MVAKKELKAKPLLIGFAPFEFAQKVNNEAHNIEKFSGFLKYS